MQSIRPFLLASITLMAALGLAVVLALVPWGSSPAVLADPFSFDFDVVLCDGTEGPNDPTCSGAIDGSAGNGDGIVQAGESPDTVTVVSVDTVLPPSADQPFLDLASTSFTGLVAAPGAAITDGAWTGTMEVAIESNLVAALASNVNGLTGQPPVCPAGEGTLGDTFPLFDADLGTAADEDVSGLGPGLILETETQGDNFSADGSETPNGLADGIDLMPDALANYLIPNLAFGMPDARSFGVATVSAALGVTIDVNLLLYDLGDGEYLALTILGYPGVPIEQPSGVSLTSQTVVTCPPFTSTIRLFGMTKDNDDTTAVEPQVAQRTAVEGTHDFKIIVSSGDNYDGDEAATPYDSCPAVASADTDLAPAGAVDPDTDRWDSACDPYPGSADNDADGTVGPYNLPVVGTFPLSPGHCNQPYVTEGGWECDQDVDGDTTLNTVDNCPTVPDADVVETGMEDGSGPVEPGEGDCYDGLDNDSDCPGDTDGDTVVCGPGDDGVDWRDPECFDFVYWQLDSDGDTVGDVCDGSPLIKGGGSGYAIDGHPHGLPGEPGGYTDHDRVCDDQFTVPGTEATGDAVCVETVDSGNDGEPDFLDGDGDTVYDIGEPADTDSDADGDGHTDSCEALRGTDPLEAESVPSGPSAAGDCDGDTVSDSEEELDGVAGILSPRHTFVNNTASNPANDLHVVFSGKEGIEIRDLRLVQNAAGCDSPTMTIEAPMTIKLEWPAQCVDSGDGVKVEVTFGQLPAGVHKVTWTIDGVPQLTHTPSPQSGQTATPTATPTPTPTPTPAPVETDGATIGSGGGTVPADPVSPEDPVDASVTIPAGALGGDTDITITEFTDTDPGLPPPPPDSLPRVLEFGPEGTTFNEDVTIVVSYDESAVPGGVEEAELRVNLLVSGSYLTVGDCTSANPPVPNPCVSGRDTTANTIAIVTRQFSVYAVSPFACTLPFTQVVPGDSDCDGAPDDAELGLDPTICGSRDPLNPWDFYDVPVPTLGGGGTMADRDSAVTLFNDVLGVLEYSGTIDEGPPNGAGRDYDDDIDGDGIDDGVAYDREVGAPWPELGVGKSHSGPPGGAVTLFVDVLLVLDQSGHICTP